MIGDMVRSLLTPRCPKCGGAVASVEHLEQVSTHGYRLVKRKQCGRCGWHHGYVRRHCEADDC